MIEFSNRLLLPNQFVNAYRSLQVQNLRQQVQLQQGSKLLLNYRLVSFHKRRRGEKVALKYSKRKPSVWLLNNYKRDTITPRNQIP